MRRRHLVVVALLSLGLSLPARAEDPDSIYRALMEYIPVAVGATGTMAATTVTLTGKALAYYADLKRTKALIDANEPVFREHLQHLDESFTSLREIYYRLGVLASVLPEGKQTLRHLEKLVRQHGLEALANHPKLGKEWAGRYRDLRAEERERKQKLSDAWNGILSTAKKLGDTEVHKLSEARAESLLRQIQAPLNELATLSPVNDPDGNEPLGKLIRSNETMSNEVAYAALRSNELPRLQSACRHIIAGLEGANRGMRARSVRMKLYGWAAAGSGVTTLTLAATGLYIHMNPTDKTRTGKPGDPKSTETPIGLDALQHSTLPPALPVAEEAGPLESKDSEVGRAGDTTESISGRRNTPKKKENTTSGIATRRRGN